MKTYKKRYIFRIVIPVVLMMLALAWLTVSIAFVNPTLQGENYSAAGNKTCDDSENSCNPFANTTEEKTETSPNSINEYLHCMDELAAPIKIPVKYEKCTHASTYIAYHGELLSPPPEIKNI